MYLGIKDSENRLQNTSRLKKRSLIVAQTEKELELSQIDMSAMLKIRPSSSF